MQDFSSTSVASSEVHLTARVHRYVPDFLKCPQERFAHDIEGAVVGPVPVKEFLDKFLPLPRNSTDTWTQLENADVKCTEIEFVSVPNPPETEEVCKGIVSARPLISPACLI